MIPDWDDDDEPTDDVDNSDDHHMPDEQLWPFSEPIE